MSAISGTSSALAFTNRAVIGDRSMQKEFADLIMENPSQPAPFILLGYSLEEEDRVEIDGVIYDKQKCFIEALRRDKHNSAAWNNTGYTLVGDETVEVNGEVVDKTECFKRGVLTNPQNPAAWNNLGFSLPDDETVTIDGQAFGKRDCFQNALSRDPTDSTAWNNIGHTLGVHEALVIEDGETYTKLDCFLNALRFDPTNAAAWKNLALLMGDDELVEVDGQMYSKRECLTEAINEDPFYTNAWVELGKTLGTDTLNVDDRELTARDCVRIALETNPESAAAWKAMGELMDDDESFVLREGDASMTKQECLDHAAKLEEEDKARGPSQRDIKPTARNRQKVSVAKKKELISQLKRNPHNPRAWYELARMMGSEETIMVNGQEMDKMDCYIRSAESKPDNSYAWNNIGAFMIQQKRDTVEVSGLEYDAREAFAKAATNDSHNTYAWKNLSKTLREKGATVVVGYTDVDRETALKAAEGELPKKQHMEVQVVNAKKPSLNKTLDVVCAHSRMVVRSRNAHKLLSHPNGESLAETALARDVGDCLNLPAGALNVTAVRGGSLVAEVAVPYGSELGKLHLFRCKQLAKDVKNLTGLDEPHAIEQVTVMPDGGATCSVTVRGFATDTGAKAVEHDGTVMWEHGGNVAVPSPEKDECYIVVRSGSHMEHGNFKPNKLKRDKWNDVHLTLDKGAKVHLRILPNFGQDSSNESSTTSDDEHAERALLAAEAQSSSATSSTTTTSSTSKESSRERRRKLLDECDSDEALDRHITTSESSSEDEDDDFKHPIKTSTSSSSTSSSSSPSTTTTSSSSSSTPDQRDIVAKKSTSISSTSSTSSSSSSVHRDLQTTSDDDGDISKISSVHTKSLTSSTGSSLSQGYRDIDSSATTSSTTSSSPSSNFSSTTTSTTSSSSSTPDQRDIVAKKSTSSSSTSITSTSSSSSSSTSSHDYEDTARSHPVDLNDYQPYERHANPTAEALAGEIREGRPDTYSWYSIALALGDGKTVVAPAMARVTRKDCFKLALIQEPNYVPAMVGLASCTARDETVTIKGSHMTRSDLLKNALMLDPLNTQAKELLEVDVHAKAQTHTEMHQEHQPMPL